MWCRAPIARKRKRSPTPDWLSLLSMKSGQTWITHCSFRPRRRCRQFGRISVRMLQLVLLEVGDVAWERRPSKLSEAPLGSSTNASNGSSRRRESSPCMTRKYKRPKIRRHRTEPHKNTNETKHSDEGCFIRNRQPARL